MKTKYQVTFTKNGFVVSISIQAAESADQAIEFARMYHAVGNAKGRAVPVDELSDSEDR